MAKGLCGYGVSTFCVNCSQITCLNYYDVIKDEFPNARIVRKVKDKNK